MACAEGILCSDEEKGREGWIGDVAEREEAGGRLDLAPASSSVNQTRGYSAPPPSFFSPSFDVMAVSSRGKVPSGVRLST